MVLKSSLLSGKTVLITGSGRGIGRTTAEEFAAHGANVYLNSRSRNSLHDVCNGLSKKYNVNVNALYFDVNNKKEIKSSFDKLIKLKVSLDCLINNAGILKDSLFPMTSEENVKEIFQTNFYGTFYCSQLASRMMSRKKSGSIINISSIVGVNGNEGQSAYSASKAAVIGLTKSLAKELAPLSIRVNAIAPGFIDTNMIKMVPEEKSKKIILDIKMGRIGNAKDIAGTCIYLASDLSNYVTGQVIGVDGGMMI